MEDTTSAVKLEKLPAHFDRAAEQARDLGAGQAANAFEKSARTLRASMRGWLDELMTMQEAVKYSGYTDTGIRKAEKRGELTNHGEPGAPLYRRGDLPRKPGCPVPLIRLDG